MTFFGSKFMFYFFGSIVGIVAGAILFLISYSLFLPVSAETGLVAGAIALCVILGGVIAYFSYRVTKQFTV
jgi:hypothetical protein